MEIERRRRKRGREDSVMKGEEEARAVASKPSGQSRSKQGMEESSLP